ncbi:hypothetical protein [Pseudomonas boanensis]|uniref:hypothetical protein n=1 Tax=Metapseudomonas boanensis TaxID=2822138 RepID=UPI0035D4DAD6
MQNITAIQLMAAALVIVNLGWPWIALRMVRNARATGYDEGHQIAREAAAERIALLNADIGELHLTRQQELTRHQLERDEIIQDADRRIAEYARRSNPFNEWDLGTLADVASTLDLAASTFAGLQARDKARIALQQIGLASRMHERLKDALEANARTQQLPELEAAA